MFIKIILLLFLISCSNNKINEHIRKKDVVSYYINKEASLLTEKVILNTFKEWEKVSHFDFLFSGRYKASVKRDGKNVVSFFKKWPKNLPYKLAYCKNYYDKNGFIVESDIAFNMEIAKFTSKYNHTIGAYYIEGVLSHEIGHMIGLKHSEIDNSIMKSESPIEESFFKGEIDFHTIEMYKNLYKNILK